MTIVRSVLICCLISLLTGVALFFLGSFAGYEQFKGGYAILSFDDSLSDKYIREHLDKGRVLFSGYPVSESSLWVMLDVFGSIEQVPLDEYNDRVLPFDPRNDGYAEKLKSFFVRDGVRYVYVPLLAGNWKDTTLNNQFTSLLQDIPFSIDYFGSGKPLSVYFILYGAASFCLIILCLIKKIMHHRIVNILTLIPLFSSFSFFGAEGIAAATILFGAFFLLREPLYEIASMPNLFSGALKKKFKKEIFEPYKTHWKSLVFFFLALVLLVIFTPLKPLFLAVIFAASLVVFIISSKILSIRVKDLLDKNESLQVANARRFSPVAIKVKKRPESAFIIYMIPYIAGALAALILVPFLPGSSYTLDKEIEITVNEEDYKEHLRFQAGFSVRQLGQAAFEYYTYTPGNDGLPSIADEQADQTLNLDDFPSFPLKHLIDFLNNVNNE